MSGYPELRIEVNAQKALLKLLHPDQIEESKKQEFFLAIFFALIRKLALDKKFPSETSAATPSSESEEIKKRRQWFEAILGLNQSISNPSVLPTDFVIKNVTTEEESQSVIIELFMSGKTYQVPITTEEVQFFKNGQTPELKSPVGEADAAAMAAIVVGQGLAPVPVPELPSAIARPMQISQGALFGAPMMLIRAAKEEVTSRVRGYFSEWNLSSGGHVGVFGQDSHDSEKKTFSYKPDAGRYKAKRTLARLDEMSKTFSGAGNEVKIRQHLEAIFILEDEISKLKKVTDIKIFGWTVYKRADRVGKFEEDVKKLRDNFKQELGHPGLLRFYLSIKEKLNTIGQQSSFGIQLHSLLSMIVQVIAGTKSQLDFMEELRRVSRQMGKDQHRVSRPRAERLDAELIGDDVAKLIYKSCQDQLAEMERANDAVFLPANDLGLPASLLRFSAPASVRVDIQNLTGKEVPDLEQSRKVIVSLLRAVSMKEVTTENLAIYRATYGRFKEDEKNKTQQEINYLLAIFSEYAGWIKDLDGDGVAYAALAEKLQTPKESYRQYRYAHAFPTIKVSEWFVDFFKSANTAANKTKTLEKLVTQAGSISLFDALINNFKTDSLDTLAQQYPLSRKVEFFDAIKKVLLNEASVVGFQTFESLSTLLEKLPSLLSPAELTLIKSQWFRATFTVSDAAGIFALLRDENEILRKAGILDDETFKNHITTFCKRYIDSLTEVNFVAQYQAMLETPVFNSLSPAQKETVAQYAVNFMIEEAKTDSACLIFLKHYTMNLLSGGLLQCGQKRCAPKSMRKITVRQSKRI